MRMTRSTSMPLAAARLALSDTALVALPMRVRSRKNPTARSMTMLTAMLAMSTQESATAPNRMSDGSVAPGSWLVDPP
jgi:hypothetical protein